MSNLLEATHADPVAAFRVLDWPIQFSLDTDALDHHVFNLQCKYHPDRFTDQSEKAEEAEKKFATIVWAHQTLKDPKTRARLLFQQAGLWPAPHHPSVLHELFDIEEAIESNQISLKELQKQSKKALQDLAFFLDAKDFTEAGTAYMRFNGLMRLQKNLIHTADITP